MLASVSRMNSELASNFGYERTGAVVSNSFSLSKASWHLVVH